MGAYVTGRNLKAKTRAWLKGVARWNRQGMRLKPAKAALVVVDMQNYFLARGASAYLPASRAVVPVVKRTLAAFREAGRPVVFTRHAHDPHGLDAGIMGWWWDDLCLEGSPESELFHGMAPVPGEKVILKHRYSAFYNTDLETVLRVARVEDLVIVGVMTNLCCESTARDAHNRDYRVFFPADGTATVSEEMHVATLTNLAYGFAKVVAAEEVLAAFAK